MKYQILEIHMHGEREIKRQLTPLSTSDCYEALDMARELSIEGKKHGIRYAVCPILL